MSTAQKVKSRIKLLRKGVPFSTRDPGWADLGTSKAINITLSRLVQSGEIERIERGIYVRPKSLTVAPHIKVSASAETLARYWAKINGHILVHQADEAAYRLGLQLQAPMKLVFWTDGPSRQFQQGADIAEVKHVRQKLLIWPNQPEGDVFRSLLVISPDSVTAGTWRNMLTRLSIPHSDFKGLICRLLKADLPMGWRVKLKDLEHTLD